MRILHIPCKSDVVYCGVIANTGTRDELQNEHGMAHLLEHLFFKGTKKRSQYQVMNCLETVGGELNAYTTKEETVVYSIALKRDFSRAVDLIMDIIFNSTINEDELQKEKEVVKELNKGNKPLHYLKNVAGKIDVKGFEVSISGEPDPELLEIYNLIKDATFSAKNYDSMT